VLSNVLHETFGGEDGAWRDAILRVAIGARLSADAFKAHLVARYLDEGPVGALTRARVAALN
jgi:hypothetical protein